MLYILTDDRDTVLEVSWDKYQIRRIGKAFVKLGQPVRVYWHNGFERFFSPLNTRLCN